MRDVVRNGRGLAVAAVLLACAGCGGALSDARGVGLQEPEITFLDIFDKSGGSKAVTPVGTLTVVLGVRNPNEVPLTLRRVQVDVRGSEDLQVERRSHTLEIAIGPGQQARVPLDLLFTLEEARPNIYATLPRLTAAGQARFDSPKGGFQTAFVVSMGQRPQARDGEGGD